MAESSRAPPFSLLPSRHGSRGTHAVGSFIEPIEFFQQRSIPPAIAASTRLLSLTSRFDAKTSCDLIELLWQRAQRGGDVSDRTRAAGEVLKSLGRELPLRRACK